ncbi:MAG: hypothetical protein QME96_06255 [Myxococcota bacterium]|nr:hypothetical protein [Myxococcota bacterium]
MSAVVGIDPGKRGAVVALDLDGHVVRAVAADRRPDGYCPDDYLPGRMAEALRGLDARLVVVERQGAHPKEGRTSCLTTGRGQGLWEGLCAGLGLPHRLVQPAVWRRALGVPVGTADRKAGVVELVDRRLPDLELVLPGRRTLHDGLADAGGLALYALREWLGETNGRGGASFAATLG